MFETWLDMIFGGHWAGISGGYRAIAPWAAVPLGIWLVVVTSGKRSVVDVRRRLRAEVKALAEPGLVADAEEVIRTVSAPVLAAAGQHRVMPTGNGMWTRRSDSARLAALAGLTPPGIAELQHELRVIAELKGQS